MSHFKTWHYMFSSPQIKCDIEIILLIIEHPFLMPIVNGEAERPFSKNEKNQNQPQLFRWSKTSRKYCWYLDRGLVPEKFYFFSAMNACYGKKV